MQPSKQARSLATQQRILRATESLLGSQSFDSISIRRIVKEAKTSTGAFYARFEDKGALLPALYADHERRLDRRIAKLRLAVGGAASLDAIAALVADHFVVSFGEIPNLSRALFEYATRDPDSSLAQRHAEQRLDQYGFLVEALLSHQDQISHPNPGRAAELCLYFVTVTCRNRLFYPLYPQTRKLKIGKGELRAELARLMTAYLRG